MNHLVFFLEEPSAKAMLEGLLPKIFPEDAVFRFIVFEGKQDLEKQIVNRMRHYRVPDAKFVILRDKDAANCKIIKQGLLTKCQEAGKPDTLIRIACYELESWFLGDLQAVEKGLKGNNLARQQNTRLYRAPDTYPSPYQTLRRLVPQYQKVSGARAIGPYLAQDNNRSQSFSVFISGLIKLMEP